MFTRIAAVISIVLAIIVFILAVIAYYISGENWVVFAIVFLLGGGTIFMFELFVELVNNVRDIKLLIKENTKAIKALNNKLNVTPTEANDGKQEIRESVFDVKL